MITEKLRILSSELETDFEFTIDEYGSMVDMTILENMDGISVPRFALLVDDENSDERFVLSVLESPETILFGSSICETIKVFVSSNIEEIFEVMKKETLLIKEREK